MQRHPVRIRTHGLDGICRGATPAQLAGLDSGWEHDIARFGPWLQEKDGVYSDSVRLAAPLFCYGASSSTMDIMWALSAEKNLPAFATVVSSSQHAGRGQLRRSWQSMPGNLYVSLLLPEVSEEWKNLSSLLAGYAVCSTLENTGVATQLKWPNDLVQDERKVGGLLIEERRGRQVMGLGINLVHAPGKTSLRDRAALPAGVLSFDSSGGGPLLLLSRIHEGFQEAWTSIQAANDRASFVKSLERRLAWVGCRVRETENGGEGVLAGLAPDGGLRLVGSRGESVLYSGSIVPV